MHFMFYILRLFYVRFFIFFSFSFDLARLSDVVYCMLYLMHDLLWFAIHSIVTGQIESYTVNTERAIGTVDAQMKDFESDHKISRDTSQIAQKHQHFRYMYI